MEKELSRAHHYAYQPKNEDSIVNIVIGVLKVWLKGNVKDVGDYNQEGNNSPSPTQSKQTKTI